MGTSYRANQVGSLLRPREILEARENVPLDAERLRAFEDRHILRVVARQLELGFEAVTNGGLRRRNFMSDFTDAVDGFDLEDATARTWRAGGANAVPVSSVTGIVTGRLRSNRRLTATSRVRALSERTHVECRDLVGRPSRGTAKHD